MQEEKQKEHIMKKFPGTDSAKNNFAIVLGAILVVLAGVGTGYLFSGSQAKTQRKTDVNIENGVKIGKDEAGVEDESVFSDSAEGVLVSGGIEGEGTHHLDRGLGPEKNVYLTSTIIDLESFVGKTVKVWGETISAQNAPWLMDVGKIKKVE